MADKSNTTKRKHTPLAVPLPGSYLWPVELNGGGWTSGLFSIDGELIDEFGFWKTRKDAVWGCTIMKERLGCQVMS